MTTAWRRRISGAAMGLAGAFFWALQWVGWNNRNSSDWLWSTPLLAAYATLIASWFVLPLGAFVGTTLPRLIANRSSLSAFGIGVLVGILAGTISAMVTTSWFDILPSLTGQSTIVNFEAWRQSVMMRFLRMTITMSAVSALWIGAWATRLNRINQLRRQPPSAEGAP